MPKTIDVCGNEVSLLVSNENCEVLSDMLQSKSILEDGIISKQWMYRVFDEFWIFVLFVS